MTPNTYYFSGFHPNETTSTPKSSPWKGTQKTISCNWKWKKGRTGQSSRIFCRYLGHYCHLPPPQFQCACSSSCATTLRQLFLFFFADLLAVFLSYHLISMIGRFPTILYMLIKLTLIFLFLHLSPSIVAQIFLFFSRCGLSRLVLSTYSLCIVVFDMFPATFPEKRWVVCVSSQLCSLSTTSI